MNDTTSSLYEHIKNRLPPGYGYGNDGQVIVDKVKSQAVWQQTLREDHPGDVGIFEIKTDHEYGQFGFLGYKTTVQVAVVCKPGELNKVRQYLEQLSNNLYTDKLSSGIKVKNCTNQKIMNLGENSDGKQMVELYITISYCYINNNNNVSNS